MTSTLPVWIEDPVNAAILAIGEDRLAGFQLDPFGEIATRADLSVSLVLERIVAMLEAGTIRRVRQTLMTTSLAPSALVAWDVPDETLDDAFDYLVREDPFAGHCVIRTTDGAAPGSNYRLWTTLDVPQGFAIEKHARYLAGQIGAPRLRVMPARCSFVLGAGNVRRRSLPPGARADAPAKAVNTEIVALDEREWHVLTAIEREFRAGEIVRDVWAARAREAGVSPAEFERIAGALNARGVIGRFSIALERAKPNQEVTRCNALLHWAVPPGRELEAGGEVGRHYCMRHAYWREGGPEFRNVNIMGVLRGSDKGEVLAHKAAIDEHLREAGIDVGYTNVFWAGRNEIKPSEISPLAYEAYCRAQGLDPDAMRAAP